MAATPILEAPSARKHRRDPFADLLAYAEETERRLDAAAGAVKLADGVITASENILAALPFRPPAHHEKGELADVGRALERLRRKRDELLREHVDDPDAYISVEELRRGIGRSEKATRNLLEQGQIPGAERITPGKKNSPWLIPRASIATFNRRES